MKQITGFKMEGHQSRNFHGSISIVKVSNKHFAVLKLDENNVYIYNCIESYDESKQSYDYNWSYENPIFVHFDSPEYPLDENNVGLVDDYHKKLNEYRSGKHIQEWIKNNMC